MKTLTLILSALLSTSVLANSNEAVLYSLSQLEGKHIAKILETNVNNLSIYETKTLQFKAYPSYKKDGFTCRDVTIAKNKNYGDMSVCKIGGDWVFVYE
jgi:hypothetical protein